MPMRPPPSPRSDSPVNRRQKEALKTCLLGHLDGLLVEGFKGGLVIEVQIKDGTIQSWETAIRREYPADVQPPSEPSPRLSEPRA